MHLYTNHPYDPPPTWWSWSDIDHGNELPHASRELESKWLGPHELPQMDLNHLLVRCADSVSEDNIGSAEILINELEHKVSVSGDPLQRLAAYMLEGIRARLLSSGSIVYKKLKSSTLTSQELMSSMGLLYNRCPYIKFAYFTTNVVISEAMEDESKIHIIDFCIGHGTQWMFLIDSLAKRAGGAPFIRITGVDESQNARARGGGLELVGQRLAKAAESLGVPFAFHAAGSSGCEVTRESLYIEQGEAVAVNFAYSLHRIPDESVDCTNHRDRLLRLAKSLSPKVMTLVGQEIDTNTSPFFHRFCETLDYYRAIFESIDEGTSRNDKHRINAERYCMALDIINIIACEGAEREERHEPFDKFRMRLMMAGFSQCPLSPAVQNTMNGILTEYSKNFRLQEKDDALFLGWKNRDLCTCSAWR